MSDYDQLLSKSKEDLEAIAVQFGDFTAEVAATKTREELIAAISGTPVLEEKPSKPAAKRTTKKKAEAKTEDAPAAEEKPKKEVKKAAAKKTTAKASKKTEEKTEEKPEEKVEEAASEKPAKTTSKAKKTPAKKTSKKKEEANISIEEMLNTAWKLFAKYFSPAETGIKQALVDKYWKS